jgi:hypothetical protein
VKNFLGWIAILLTASHTCAGTLFYASVINSDLLRGSVNITCNMKKGYRLVGARANQNVNSFLFHSFHQKQLRLLMNKRFPLSFLFVVLSSVTAMQADTIYRETFGSTVNSSPLSGVSWSGYAGSAAGILADNLLGLSNAGGSPSNLDNINAGLSASQSLGFAFASTTSNVFVYTSEYTVDTSLWNISSISFYSGVTSPAVGYHIAVQIGDNWYATTASLTNSTSVANAAAFAAGAQQVTFNWTTDASSWSALNFTAGTTLSLGSPLISSLPSGNITGFGLYSPSNSSGAVRRFDTFQIDALAAIPESTSWGTALGAGLAIVVLGRVKQRLQM